MNRSWKNKPHSGRGLPFRGSRGRGWNSKYYGRPPPLFENPIVTNNKYRFINPNQHRRYYEEQMPHQYEYPLNQGNPWVHQHHNNFEYKHQNHHFIPPHPPPPLLPLNPPRLARPPSPLPGSEEYIQREINEKSAYLKRHLALVVPPEHNFLEDSDISNFSDHLYKSNITSNESNLSEMNSENAMTQKNEIVRKQHKPMRQQKPQNALNANEIHSKILNHISNMSFGQKVNLVNQVTPTSYDVALQQINRQKRLELSKVLRDMCNDQLKMDQNSTEIINSIIPDFDIKIEELPLELVDQLSTTLNENLSEVIQDCSVDPELFFQQAAEMLNTSLEIENSNLEEVNCNSQILEKIPKDRAMETQFQNVENTTIPIKFKENIFDNQSYLPPTLIDFQVQNDDSNNLNSKSMLTEPLVDDLLPSVRNNGFTAEEFYENETNDSNNLISKSVLNESLEDDFLPPVQNDDLTVDEFYGNEENLPSTIAEEHNPRLLSNRFEFDHETESLLNFEETSQYRNPWFNPSPSLGKDENFLSTITKSPQLPRQESPQTLTDPSWDLPTIEESNVNFEEACQDDQIIQSNLNFINKPCSDEEKSEILESNLDFVNKPCPNVGSQVLESDIKPCPDEEERQSIKSNLNLVKKSCSDEEQNEIVESNLNMTNEMCQNEEQKNQLIVQTIKPVVKFLRNELNQKDDILVENNTPDINKNRYEEETENYKSSDSSSTEYAERLSSESSKTCSPEKGYKREQEKLRKMQKRTYREERRSHKYRNKYADEKRDRRGEERLRERDFEEGRRHLKDRWNHDTRHPKRYYRDELHPHRLEYEDENVYVHNKHKNSYQRSKSNYYYSYDEYSRKHKDVKDYKKPEKQKGDVLKDRIDKKLISRSTSEERNNKYLQKSLKDRIEMMLKHSTKSMCENSKAEESLMLQNYEDEVEQYREEEKDLLPKKIEPEAIEDNNSPNEVAQDDLKVGSETGKKTIENLELEDIILKKEVEIDLSRDCCKDENNWENSKSEDVLLNEISQLLQEDNAFNEEDFSPPCTPPLLNNVYAQKNQVGEEVQTVDVVPSVSTIRTCIQEHLKQTPPKIWRSPGEKKFMMELYPPQLEQNLVVAKARIESTQLCSKPDQAINNGHLMVLTNRTNALPFSETNTTDIVAELENCINSMTKSTAIEILNSSEVSSTSDTLKLHEKSELKRAAKPFRQNSESCKKNLEKINDTDKNESCLQFKKMQQSTSTQTSVRYKSASVQVIPNLEVQSISTGIQTNPVVAFENNNEIFEASYTASGINKKILKATHKKKVVERMRAIDKEIERLTKLRQNLYNFITSDNDSDNDPATSSHSKQSGKRKRKGSVKSKSNKKSRKKSPNKKNRDNLNIHSVAVISEKRSRSSLSHKSNVSENCEIEVPAENYASAASKGIVVSEKGSKPSWNRKSKMWEDLERAASVESYGKTETKDTMRKEKAERRSESSLSHRSRASENRDRGPSVESHGRGESKDGVTERRSESSLSHKSKTSECASVDSHRMGEPKDIVNDKRSNSSSSHKSRSLENHKRGGSKDSHGKGKSKDNVGKSISHKSNNEVSASEEIRKRDAFKSKGGSDRVEKLPESTVSCKNESSENREKGSSVVSHKRTVVSDKIVKKSRSNHKNSTLENRERDASTESNPKTPIVVIKKIVQTPASRHNRERCESIEKKVYKVERKSEPSNKYISPGKCDLSEISTSDVSAEIPSTSSEEITNVFCSDSGVVKRKAMKGKIEKIKSNSIKKSVKRSYARKSQTWKKRGKNSEKVKKVKLDKIAASLENSATSTIHESITDVANIETTPTMETSNISFDENCTNIESVTSASCSTNIARTSSVLCNPSDVSNLSCTTSLKINSSVLPSVITESDTTSSGSVSQVTRNRLKMKGPKRKSNNQYSKTIEEVIKDKTDILKLDNLEATSEILPVVSSIATVASDADDLCVPTVKSISNVSLAANIKTAVISKSDAELVSPKLSEIVPPNRFKMKGPRGRKLNNHYSKTIEEVVKESIDVPVQDNSELTSESEIQPITSSVSNVSTAVITESNIELVPSKLLENVPQVSPNRLKMQGPRGKKPNNHYSETIEEVATEKLDVLDGPEPTNEMLPITSSISCDDAINRFSSGTDVVTESDSEVVLSASEIVPPITLKRFKMKGPRGKKSNNQNNKTIKEVARENIDVPVLDNPEPVNEILLIGSDDSFNENETKKRPSKRRREVESNIGIEKNKKFKAGKRRISNRTNSVEIVGKINMFPVVSLPRCEELEIKLKDLPNGSYFSNDIDENVSSPIENMLAVKEENEDESTKIKQEDSTDEVINTSEIKSITPCLVVDENYEINFSGFTGAILVIKVIASTAIAASDKGKLFWFNLLTGELLSTHHLSNLPITSIVVVNRNDESVMYIGSLDTSITIMNFEANTIVKKDKVDEPIQCMELGWNCIFIGSARGSLITYDLKTEQVTEDIKISESNVLMIKATQEGPRKVLVIATRNALVSIRDAKTGLLLRTMETPFLPTVYTLLFDKNLIYCGTSQHDILVYTFEDGQLIFKHEATKSKGVVCMQIVGNLLFAGCYNGNIYVYNTKTNVYLGTMSGPGGLMLSMEIVQDKIIVGTKSSNFKAWRIPQKYLDQN